MSCDTFTPPICASRYREHSSDNTPSQLREWQHLFFKQTLTKACLELKTARLGSFWACRSLKKPAQITNECVKVAKWLGALWSQLLASNIIIIITRFSSPRGLGALQQLLNDTLPSIYKAMCNLINMVSLLQSGPRQWWWWPAPAVQPAAGCVATHCRASPATPSTPSHWPSMTPLTTHGVALHCNFF